MALDLPDFPWDSLADATATARSAVFADGFAGGIVDLSVGSPVDPTPEIIRESLREATDAHSYPQVAGTPALRAAIIEWYARRRGVTGLGDLNVLPTIGSKELIAGMALWLGIGRGDTVVYPKNAYPTYELGAALVGATALASDDPDEWPESTRLIWLNSPGNPDGSVLTVEAMRRAVERGRELGAVIAGDECYAELGWTPEYDTVATPSILDERVIGDTRHNVVSVYSLSKQSNLAGYRAGFVAGCAEVVQQLLGVRKHAGLMPPAPVQRAMVTALGDEAHVRAQKELYRSRRDRLSAALVQAGFRIDESEAGLYLWATRGEDAWATVSWLANRGILVAPGTFYGTGGASHVRIALTTTDERIDAAVHRLTAS